MMRQGFALLLVVAVSGRAAFAGIPAFEEGNIQTRCGGVPVKEFGGTWIYGGAPDLMDDVTFQQGNARPREKIAPKPAQTLKGNFFGVAVWYEDDQRDDGYRHVPATLTLPFAAKSLWAYDPLNGVRQRLDLTIEGGETTVRGLMVGDAPLFVAEDD